MLTRKAVSQASYGRRGGIAGGTISRAWLCPNFSGQVLQKHKFWYLGWEESRSWLMLRTA